MATDASDLQAILRRIERLERENKRLRRAGLALVVLSAGVLATYHWRAAGGTIEASGLVIRDRQGRHRVEVTMDYGTDPNGHPGIRLLNEKGIPLSTLGAGVLTINDQRGTVTATLLDNALQFNTEAGVSARLDSDKAGGNLSLFGGPSGASISLLAGPPRVEVSGGDGFVAFLGKTSLAVDGTGEHFSGPQLRLSYPVRMARFCGRRRELA